MRVLKSIGRAIDWLLDRLWMLVCAAVIASALTGCANTIPRPQITSMNPRVYNNLQFLYLTVQVGAQREFVYCLYGRVAADTMFIERLELAEIDLANGSNTNANYEDDDCLGHGMLGTGHSHPPGYACELSETDWATFRKSRRVRYFFLTCQGRMLTVFHRRQIPGGAK